MSVNVRNNNIDGALRILRTQSASTLSAVREKKEYKKPGVRRREEKKKNIMKKPCFGNLYSLRQKNSGLNLKNTLIKKA